MATIQVQQKHITDGWHCDSGHCPIALALKDAGFEHVKVEPGYIILGNDWYVTTKEVKDWINTYDMRGHVEPFSFEIKVLIRQV